MPTEADTCRKYVVPRLQAAGWDSDPYSIAEQRTITDGRVVPVGKGYRSFLGVGGELEAGYTPEDFACGIIGAYVEQTLKRKLVKLVPISAKRRRR